LLGRAISGGARKRSMMLGEMLVFGLRLRFALEKVSENRVN